MIIRTARESDVAGVLPMVAAICAMHKAWDHEKFGFVEDIVERYARWFPERIRDPRSVFLVAEMDRALAGYLVGTMEDEVPIYWIREHGRIHDVWVEPFARRHGAGRMLVEEAVRRFAAIGARQVRLETAAMNEASRAMFAACGFRASAVEMLRASPDA